MRQQRIHEKQTLNNESRSLDVKIGKDSLVLMTTTMPLLTVLGGEHLSTNFTMIPDPLVLIHVPFVVRSCVEPSSARIAVVTVPASVQLHVLGQVTGRVV